MEGGNPTSLLLIAPLLLVFGTTILVTIAGGTMSDAKAAAKAFVYAFTAKVRPAGDVVPTVVSLAEKARKEGLLALEDQLKDIDDPFLVKGVTMAIDGTDPEELRDILESELYAKKAHDKHSAKFFADAGAYAPTIGIIGTVMGLVHVLENLAKPEELGHLIAAAFIATLWGVMSANVIWLPVGNRLKRLAELEAARMELVIEGISAIQSGSNPRVIAQKLQLAAPRRRAATRPRRRDMSESTPRRKRREEHEEHENHERWLVTYADMVTLLMVLFIVMFAMSVVDEKKFNALKEGLAAGFGDSTAILDGSDNLLEQAGVSDVDLIEANEYVRKMPPEEQAKFKQALAREEQLKQQRAYAEAEAEVDRLEKLLAELDAALRAKGLRNDVQAGIDERGPGAQPGVEARRLRARPGRAQPARHRR